MKKNERLLALHILTQLLQEQIPLSYLLQTTVNVTPLTQEICFGVCRQYFRLELIADSLLTKRPKSLEVWLILLIGLYQLYYLRIPDYAVVQETVALLVKINKTWAKGLVNAVLRTFCREQATRLASLQNNDAFIANHPSWLIKRLRHDYPDEWQTIMQANDQHPPMSLRVNNQQTSAVAYLAQLAEEDILGFTHPFAPQGITLNTACDVHNLPGFAVGHVSVQDIAAQLAVSLLDLKPGLRLLDACCAPGGKTCHILESQPALSACVALDIEQKRLERVQENLNRLHLDATLIKGDALYPATWWDGIPFDRILLDAPCSATGVIRRHPDIKLLRTAAEITAIAKVQRALLHALWPLLLPGGILVYATCSILQEENEQQIADFVANQANCQVLSEEKLWGHATGHGWQILPGENTMDGFFYSVLKKSM